MMMMGAANFTASLARCCRYRTAKTRQVHHLFCMLGKLAQNCTGLCKSVNPVARYIMVGLDVAKCRSPFGVVEGEG